MGGTGVGSWFGVRHVPAVEWEGFADVVRKIFASLRPDHPGIAYCLWTRRPILPDETLTGLDLDPKSRPIKVKPDEIRPPRGRICPKKKRHRRSAVAERRCLFTHNVCRRRNHTATGTQKTSPLCDRRAANTFCPIRGQN